MKPSALALVVVLSVSFFSSAAEEEAMLEKAIEIYGLERIHHSTELFFKANDDIWLELPTNMTYFVELGDRALPMLSDAPGDSEWALEVKSLAHFAIKHGWEGVGPFKWNKSGGMHVKYMNKVPESLRNWVASPVHQFQMFSLATNTRTTFTVGADGDGPSRDVALTIENTGPSALWFKTEVEVLLLPAGEGSEPEDCQYIERLDDSASSSDIRYVPIASGQRFVLHCPVDVASANRLSGANRIMVPVHCRLEEEGPIKVELLDFHPDIEQITRDKET